MKPGGKYIIEGKEYLEDALLAHCHMMVHDCRNPDWYRKIFRFMALFLRPSSGPILQHSSGTTGDPKQFELQRKAMAASAHKTLSFFSLKPGERVLLCLSVDYIAGKMMVVRALLGGLDLRITEPSSRPMKDLSGNFRFVPMVPLQVKESLDAGDDLSRIDILLIGGGELADSLKHRLTGLGSTAVFESFGMTETYTHFGLKRIGGPNPQKSFHLLKGVRIKTDTRGCLVVELPGVTPGPVLTNDLVEICEGEESFTWLGRYDNVINTGGIKVIPELLEERMGKLLGTTVLILPEKDEKLGQKMVLLLEWNMTGTKSQLEQTMARWKQKLVLNFSSHELPKRLVPVSKLPRNASLKPDRKAALALLA